MKIQNYLIGLMVLFLLAGSFFANSPKVSAGFDHNNLSSDAAFINANTLNAQGIQNFLKAKGSFLQNYSQGGRSAAQIIYDAARSNGINPIAVLAMIQKEEGIIYGVEARNFNQVRTDWAMGYGVCDSCSTSDPNIQKYRGFANQLDYGTWQLKRNYSYWAANGSEWNVGRTMIIDGQAVRFANRSTSALYRYTPHLGTNFTYYFNLWNSQAGSSAATGSYDAQYVTQGPRAGAGAPNVNLAANQRFSVWVNYRNTGGSIWYRAGTNPVRIGNSSPQDRGSPFMGGHNLRGSLVQKAVRPGQTGTFKLTLTAPSQAGTYTERFRPLAEHATWMGDEATWTFNVAGGRGAAVNGVTSSGSSVSAASYNAQYLTQGPYSGPGSLNYVLSRGQKATLWVNYKNTGSRTWSKTGANPTYLGTANPQDRGSAFFGGHNLRSILKQNSVAPGGTGTFIVQITAPQTPGTYQESFRPVTERVTWMGESVTWTLQVR